MKLNININRRMVRNWLWLWYPIGVALLVVGSSTLVFFGGVGLWFKLADRGQSVVLQEETIGMFRRKLAELKQTNKDELDMDLKMLTDAVPFSSRVWDVVSVARVAGGESGGPLLEWRAFGGEITGDSAASGSGLATMTGLFTIQDTNQLQVLLDNLEKRLPLVAVKRVVFSAEKTQIDLEGKWAPYVASGARGTTPLPGGTLAEVETVKQMLVAFRELPELPIQTEVKLGKDNPF